MGLDLSGLDAPKLIADKVKSAEDLTLTPEKIAKDLRDDFDSMDNQVTQMLEQLTIVDARIDEYDKLINKVDKKMPPLINEINSSLDDVADAYKARVAAGCKNDLAWVLLETKKGNKATAGEDSYVYQVAKDPSTRKQLNYYGVKYYRRPKNREYGANLVDQIDNANIDPLTTVLVVFDDDAGDLIGIASTDGIEYSDSGSPATIKLGDFITDDLDDPQIFATGNLPTVVGLGTTSYPKERGNITGMTTSGTSKFYENRAVGLASDFKVGDVLYADNVFPQGTTITGFEESTFDATFVNNVGVTTTEEIVIDVFLTSNPAIATTEGHQIQVGIVSTYPAVFLSTITQVGATNSSFLIVRPPDVGGIEFEETKNPIDPVEIGIAEGNRVGKGNKVELVNNGDPKIVASWHEVRDEPEPAVGAGFVEYWEGNDQWPTLTTNDGDGPSDVEYVAEGTTVTISFGSTVSGSIGYGVNPNNPSGCGGLDSAISSAESDRDAKIAVNKPKVEYYTGVTAALRDLRDELETQAWSFMQGVGHINEKKRKDTERAVQLENLDWTEFED
jgi:hypothetical protein